MSIIYVSGRGFRVNLRGVYVFQTTTAEVANTIERRLGNGLDPSWRKRAKCIDKPKSWFFPRRTRDKEKALALCEFCSVKWECTGYALITRQEAGIWGGREFTEDMYTHTKRGRNRNVALSIQDKEIRNPFEEISERAIIRSHKAIAAKFEGKGNDGVRRDTGTEICTP